MELMQYWHVFRRRWWMLLLSTVLASSIGYLVSTRITPVYQATTLLLVNQAQSPGQIGYQDILTSQSLAKTYSELLHNEAILSETIKQLSLPMTPQELSKRTNAQVISESQLLQITVEDTDTVRAVSIADTLTQGFIKRMQRLQLSGTQSNGQQVDVELNDVRRQMVEITERLNTLRAIPAPSVDTQNEISRLQFNLAQYESRYFRLLELQQKSNTIQNQAVNSILIVESAHASPIPVQPKPGRNAILAGLVGLLLASGLAFMLDFLDDRIRSTEELRDRFGLLPLATSWLVHGGTENLRPETAMSVSNQFSEAIRLLQTNLEFAALGRVTVIGVTSASAGEGKSTIVANLALAEAQAGKRVVLIDASLRDPELHQLYEISNQQGLSTYLAQEPRGAQVSLQEGPLQIKILPGGPVPPNPSELLGSQRLSDLIEHLRAQADVIFLDCAPLLPVSDTLILQRVMDGIILVVDAQHTGTRTIERALERFHKTSEKIIGVVLNKERGESTKRRRSKRLQNNRRKYESAETNVQSTVGTRL